MHSNQNYPTSSSHCIDTSTAKCFSSKEFKGNPDLPANNPTGQIDLTTDAYKSFASYVFDSCIFIDCKASYGGGIYLSVSSSSVMLKVTKGEFSSCKATKYEGGGIYVQGIGDVNVSNSLFCSCSCASEADYGGGGLDIWSIHNPPQIERCSFLSCKSENDAGGLGIWRALMYQETCVKACRFIGCTGSNTSNSYGGSLLVCYSNAAIGCSNTLFAHSHSEFRGGATAAEVYNSADHNTSIPLLCFCFFINNSAKAKPGNDVFFYEWIPNEPFFYCLSLTDTDRVSPSGHDSRWLPIGILSYLNTWNGENNPYQNNDPDNPTWLDRITEEYAETT